MIHWPGAVIQRFSNRIQPVVQDQFKPFMRPEEMPTGADTYMHSSDAAGSASDSTDEDMRQRRAAQAYAYASPSLMSARIGGNGYSVLAAPETRALVSNVFRGAADRAADLAREEAPRVAEDLGDKEYDKKRDERQKSARLQAF